MNNYLMHYGVKGQSWGVRRYQNEDGTLTEEGKERYGHLKDRGDSGLIKKWTFGSEGGSYAFAKWRERRHKKNLQKYKDIKKAAEDSGKDTSRAEKGIKKYQSKLDAQSAANRNLDAYRKHSSTAKLIIQNAMGSGTPAGHVYRKARARGESRLSAMLETGLSATPIGWIMKAKRNKKAYGKYIVFSEPSDNEYYADVIEAGDRK